MVYRHLDPARDWDAYCEDHPMPPNFVRLMKNFMFLLVVAMK